MERIRIELERSGGFAGIGLHTSVDTGTLPAEAAADITGLLDGVDLGALARLPAAGNPGGRDRFRYTLRVERGGHRHEVVLPERAVPAELKPLLDRLVGLARQTRTQQR
jgi:hypothetical protein